MFTEYGRAENRSFRPESIDLDWQEEANRSGNDYIRWVQDSLNRVLGFRLSVSGIMGPETRSAIRSFQERQGLPITGLVGPDTERSLIVAISAQSPETRAARSAKPDMPGPASASSAAEFEWDAQAPLRPHSRAKSRRAPTSGGGGLGVCTCPDPSCPEHGAEYLAELREYEILGNDDRILVSNTSAVPFRFICCVESIFTNPGGAPIRLRGTGTLISDRHVLTAAHLVLANIPQLGGRVRPASIMVSPGRNGTRMPFAASATVIDANRPRIRPEWVAAPNAQFDFSLLTLQRHLGAPSRGLGFWGHDTLGGNTRIRAIDMGRLQNLTVNLSGYPIDKCLNGPRGRPATQAELNACNNGIAAPIGFFNNRIGTTQWRSLGHIVDTSPATEPLSITYDLDTAVGHSGGPVWVNWEGFRNLVAVNTGGFPRRTAPFDIVANMGVRITAEVITQLRAWMRLDNVWANF